VLLVLTTRMFVPLVRTSFQCVTDSYSHMTKSHTIQCQSFSLNIPTCPDITTYIVSRGLVGAIARLRMVARSELGGVTLKLFREISPRRERRTHLLACNCHQ